MMLMCLGQIKFAAVTQVWWQNLNLYPLTLEPGDIARKSFYFNKYVIIKETISIFNLK